VPGIPRPRAAAILLELHSYQVEFIVVGGVAAVLEGMPVNTFDLDIVHSREPHNISRLLAALASLGATAATLPGSLLTTRFGPLDILGTIGRSAS
jgi:hypothetical protein